MVDSSKSSESPKLNKNINITDSDKEFVHILSLVTDALNIGTPFAPQLKLNRLIEIEKTFEKLSDKSYLKNLKASSRNEYEPILNLLNDEKAFNLLKSKVEMEIVQIYTMDAPNIIDFITKNPKFNLYYLECAQNYRPEGNYELRRYGDFDDINLSYIKNSFENAINTSTMKWFISDLNNYLCISPEGHYQELWMYHTEALLYNFLQLYEQMNKNMRWGEELSKELLKSMVGYSKCIDFYSDSIIAYTNNISNFVIHILDLITKILNMLNKSNINSALYNEILLEIFIFSVNLHYIFPIQEIFDFINDNIIAELDTKDSLSGKNDKVFKETKNHFEMLSNKGLVGRSYKINMDYTIPDYSVVCNMWVHQQVENPSFTVIYVGILFSKVPSPIELEFSFYDKNNQEITLGRNGSDKFTVKFGENIQRGGYYGYRITILKCSNIYGFKAKVLSGTIKNEYSSIELGTSNNTVKDEHTVNSTSTVEKTINCSMEDSKNIENINKKNKSEKGIWFALIILFIGFYLIYHFATSFEKAIEEPAIDLITIQETVQDENIQFEFMNRVAERKKHGSLEYISFIEDGYTDLFENLKNDEILVGVVSTTGLNFRQSNSVDSEVILVLNENEKVFILGESNNWYFGFNDVEDDKTEYGWFSKYYIKVYVYNFVTNEAISIEDYDFE